MRWVVIKHERVDVTTYGEVDPPVYSPGFIEGAQVVEAPSRETAMSQAADGEAGFYSAFPLPDTLPMYEASVVLRRR